MEALNYCMYSQKGSSHSLDNHIGIAKSCAVSKIWNKIILHRIKSVTESKLLALQCGLRSGRTTTEQIMTLRFLLDAARTLKRSLTIVFADDCNAFDSVDRREFAVVLKQYGAPDPVVADMVQLYHGFSAAVSINFGLTKTIDTIMVF